MKCKSAKCMHWNIIIDSVYPIVHHWFHNIRRIITLKKKSLYFHKTFLNFVVPLDTPTSSCKWMVYGSLCHCEWLRFHYKRQKHNMFIKYHWDKWCEIFAYKPQLKSLFNKLLCSEPVMVLSHISTSSNTNFYVKTGSYRQFLTFNNDSFYPNSCSFIHFCFCLCSAVKSFGLPWGTSHSSLFCLWKKREPSSQLPAPADLRRRVNV